MKPSLNSFGIAFLSILNRCCFCTVEISAQFYLLEPIHTHRSAVQRIFAAASSECKLPIHGDLVPPANTSLLQCVLAAIIVAALLGMFRKFKQLIRLWQLSKIDFVSVVELSFSISTDSRNSKISSLQEPRHCCCVHFECQQGSIIFRWNFAYLRPKVLILSSSSKV